MPSVCTISKFPSLHRMCRVFFLQAILQEHRMDKLFRYVMCACICMFVLFIHIYTHMHISVHLYVRVCVYIYKVTNCTIRIERYKTVT